MRKQKTGIRSKLLTLALLFLIAWVVHLFPEKISEFKKLSVSVGDIFDSIKKENYTKDQLASLKAEIANDPSYLTSHTKETLNLVEPGEKVFYVVNDDGTDIASASPSATAPVTGQGTTGLEKGIFTVIEKWIENLFSKN